MTYFGMTYFGMTYSLLHNSLVTVGPYKKYSTYWRIVASQSKEEIKSEYQWAKSLNKE